jgi:tetratricopeptide (TPR) repeat protein
MEIAAMLLTLNLSDYYGTHDDQKIKFYLAAAETLSRERTRIPFADHYIQQAFDFFKLLSMSTQNPIVKELAEIMTYRERVY